MDYASALTTAPRQAMAAPVRSLRPRRQVQRPAAIKPTCATFKRSSGSARSTIRWSMRPIASPTR